MVDEGRVCPTCPLVLSDKGMPGSVTWMWAGRMKVTELSSNKKRTCLESSNLGFDVSLRKGCLLDLGIL